MLKSIGKATWVILLGILLIAVSAAVFLSLTKESRPVELTNDRLISNSSIPPIDISAPARTETATFGLG